VPSSPAPNLLNADLGRIWKTFKINVLGMALVTQAFLRHRRAHCVHGAASATLISISTRGATTLRMSDSALYQASMTAALRLNELMAVDAPPTEARFISLNPRCCLTIITNQKKSDTTNLTDVNLVANWAVFAATEQAEFLNRRAVWAT
jgi:NAD(P)-dependent dehydrogenase (short-subunit alcohol dehydrogenase family)